MGLSDRTLYTREIYVDTREKPHAIRKILRAFEARGIDIIHKKLDVGDYMFHPDCRISVDRKKDLIEVCANVCQQHKRFSAECQRAKDAGIQLVILVEHGTMIRDIEDVRHWRNPRLSVSPYAVSGPRLYQIMKTYEAKYGVEWQFCCKHATGKRILQILSRD